MYILMVKKKYSVELFQATAGNFTFDLDEARVRLDTLQSLGLFAFMMKITELDFALFEEPKNGNKGADDTPAKA